MKLRKLFWLTSLAVMALIFAACGNDGGAADGGNNDGGDADASGAVELTQTETIESAEFGGTLSVSYPEGWFVSGEGGGFLISNSEEALASSGPEDFDEIPEGTVVVTVTMIPGEMAGAMGVEGDVTPAAIIDVFSGFMGGEDMPAFGDVEELTINGNPAAKTTGSDDTMSATLYAIDNDGNFAFGFGATRSDEADQHAAVIEAIISSASFTASE